MNNHAHRGLFTLAAATLFLITASTAHSEGVDFISKTVGFAAPTEDIAGSADPTLLKRFKGSIILSHYRVGYDEFTYPLSELKKVPGETDSSNNVKYEPADKLAKEGPYTRVVYLAPAGRSPLEVLRYYQKQISTTGGKTIYECKETECGGDQTHTSGGGGGVMSLSMYLFPGVKSTDKGGSPAWCATTQAMRGQRYAVAEMPNSGSHVSILAYESAKASYTNCEPYLNRTVVIVDLIEGDTSEAKTNLIDARKMSEELAAMGSISLYGIHFDTDAALVKEKSNALIKEVAALLSAEPKLRLKVVGHTDNQGVYESNKDLSQRRAEAIVTLLVQKHGVAENRLSALGAAHSSPVGTNRTKEGRAKNRRVTLVEE